MCRWMQVQAHCQVCPVCKAGIEQSKVSVEGLEGFPELWTLSPYNASLIPCLSTCTLLSLVTSLVIRLPSSHSWEG